MISKRQSHIKASSFTGGGNRSTVRGHVVMSQRLRPLSHLIPLNNRRLSEGVFRLRGIQILKAGVTLCVRSDYTCTCMPCSLTSRHRG